MYKGVVFESPRRIPVVSNNNKMAKLQSLGVVFEGDDLTSMQDTRLNEAEELQYYREFEFPMGLPQILAMCPTETERGNEHIDSGLKDTFYDFKTMGELYFDKQGVLKIRFRYNGTGDWTCLDFSTGEYADCENNFYPKETACSAIIYVSSSLAGKDVSMAAPKLRRPENVFYAGLGIEVLRALGKIPHFYEAYRTGVQNANTNTPHYENMKIIESLFTQVQNNQTISSNSSTLKSFIEAIKRLRKQLIRSKEKYPVEALANLLIPDEAKKIIQHSSITQVVHATVRASFLDTFDVDESVLEDRKQETVNLLFPGTPRVRRVGRMVYFDIVFTQLKGYMIFYSSTSTLGPTSHPNSIDFAVGDRNYTYKKYFAVLDHGSSFRTMNFRDSDDAPVCLIIYKCGQITGVVEPLSRRRDDPPPPERDDSPPQRRDDPPPPRRRDDLPPPRRNRERSIGGGGTRDGGGGSRGGSSKGGNGGGGRGGSGTGGSGGGSRGGSGTSGGSGGSGGSSTPSSTSPTPTVTTDPTPVTPTPTVPEVTPPSQQSTTVATISTGRKAILWAIPLLAAGIVFFVLCARRRALASATPATPVAPAAVVTP
jgi:hypothetical protein